MFPSDVSYVNHLSILVQHSEEASVLNILPLHRFHWKQLQLNPCTLLTILPPFQCDILYCIWVICHQKGKTCRKTPPCWASLLSDSAFEDGESRETGESTLRVRERERKIESTRERCRGLAFWEDSRYTIEAHGHTWIYSLYFSDIFLFFEGGGGLTLCCFFARTHAYSYTPFRSWKDKSENQRRGHHLPLNASQGHSQSKTRDGGGQFPHTRGPEHPFVEKNIVWLKVVERHRAPEDSLSLHMKGKWWFNNKRGRRKKYSWRSACREGIQICIGPFLSDRDAYAKEVHRPCFGGERLHFHKFLSFVFSHHNLFFFSSSDTLPALQGGAGVREEVQR